MGQTLCKFIYVPSIFKNDFLLPINVRNFFTLYFYLVICGSLQVVLKSLSFFFWDKFECMYACWLNHFSHVWLFATLWTWATAWSSVHSISRQESWRRLPCTPPRGLSNPGIKPMFLISPALAGGFCTTSSTWAEKMSLGMLSKIQVSKWMNKQI